MVAPATKRKARALAAAPAPRVSFNLNTILSGLAVVIMTVIGSIVVYMVTTGRAQAREDAAAQTKALTIVVTTLPYMQKGIDTTASDVKEVSKDLKEAKSTMVTRDELTEKNRIVTETLNEVKGSVKDVRDEQSKVRDQLIQKNLAPASTPR